MGAATTSSAAHAGSPFEILHIVGDGNPGGATTIVLELALELKRQGIIVRIASDIDSHITREARNNGVPVLEANFDSRWNTPGIRVALAKHVRSYPNTIIHAHGCRAGLPAAMLPAWHHCGLVYTVHGFHFRYKPAGIRHLAKVAERYVIRRASTTAFVSRNDARIAREHRLITDADRFQVIRNGSRAANLESRSTTDSAEFDIAFLGRLVAVKNVMLLPEILVAMRPMRPSLCVIGSGDNEEALRRAVNEAALGDQVTFMGALPHSEAMAYLRRSRAMILPSRWEGMPVSAIEAMHHGVPVVASDVGGTTEVVIDGYTGYLVEVDNVTGYAARLNQILSDPELRQSLSRRAVERALTEFSIERQLAEYVDLYFSVAASRLSGELMNYVA
jgi:glycosyltransferase involved in cell wall biosynthesis